jgi:hypothetical protein
MKRLSVDQIKSIVFTGVVAVAAVGIYLLTGVSPAGETAMAAPASAPAAAKAQGVTAERFLEALKAAGLRVVESDAPGTVFLRDPDRPGRMELVYSERGGFLSAVTLAFRFGTPDTLPEKPDAALLQILADREARRREAANASLQTMLLALTAAIDADARVPQAVALRWYDGALRAETEGSTYKDTFDDIAFTAAATLDGAEPVLRCSFLLDTVN